MVEGQECFSVQLTKGQYAIIDKADLPLVEGINWYAFKWKRGFYAARKIRLEPLCCVTQFMHNILLPTETGHEPDHRNGNGLDNRRCNLRVGTISQQRANMVKRNNPTSSHAKGVHWLKRERRWRAKIQHNYQEILIGYFRNEQDAIAAYRQADERLNGEFAVHNRQQTTNQKEIPCPAYMI